MRSVYKYPECPSCSQGINLIQGMKLLNPWRYRCPNYKTILETSRLGKGIFIFGFILGLLIAGIAIRMEDLGHWHTSESVVFFAILLLVYAVITGLLWPLVKLKIK